MKKGAGWLVFLIVVLAYSSIKDFSCDSNDKIQSDLICRVNGCGQKALYYNEDDRYCKEHLYKSINHANQYNSAWAKRKTNYKRALTEEEAEALRGTGYHGTRPNSSAENTEIRAAMRKCPKCGMYGDQGPNNLCYACRYNEEHGFD